MDDETNRRTREVSERLQAIVQREAQDLMAALNILTDLTLPLLKFHLQVEHLLERILVEHLPRADRVLGARLTFAQKLALVHAFDVIDEGAIQALRRVNSLRNRASHVKSTAITADDVDRIGRCLGAEYREIRRVDGNDLRELLISTLVAVARPLMVATIFPEVRPDMEAFGEFLSKKQEQGEK